MNQRITRRAALPLAASLFAVPLTASAQATPYPTLPEEQATRLLRRYVTDVLGNRDFDAFQSLIAADIPAQIPTDANGRDALWQRLIDSWRQGDERGVRTLTIAEVIASGNIAAARVEATWEEEYLDEYDTTGDMLIFAHVEDGVIARLWSALNWHRVE